MIIGFLAGVLVGSLPTARLIAHRAGIDLSRGSGNPGANNARRLGGWKPAGLILLVEMAKGAGVVVGAFALVTDPTAVAAGIGVVAGNVYNPWHKLRGGQGLGATAGVLLAAWPTGLAIGLALIAIASKLLHSTYRGTIVTFAGLLVIATAARMIGSPWGIDEGWIWLVAGLSALILPPQIRHLTRSGPPASPG